MRRHVLHALVLIGVSGAAFAYVPQLSAEQLNEAIAQGRELAGQKAGYPLGPYLLYDVPDAYVADPALGSVEAVQVATPYERARWQGYLLAVQAKPVTAEAVRNRMGIGPDELLLVVYAHSAGEDDRDFQQRFSPATLQVQGNTLRAPPQAGETSLNSYRDPDGRVVDRWTGQVTYRFDLRGVQGTQDARVTAEFTDAAGRTYRLPLHLARVK